MHESEIFKSSRAIFTHNALVEFKVLMGKSNQILIALTVFLCNTYVCTALKHVLGSFSCP